MEKKTYTTTGIFKPQKRRELSGRPNTIVLTTWCLVLPREVQSINWLTSEKWKSWLARSKIEGIVSIQAACMPQPTPCPTHCQAPKEEKEEEEEEDKFMTVTR